MTHKPFNYLLGYSAGMLLPLFIKPQRRLRMRPWLPQPWLLKRHRHLSVLLTPRTKACWPRCGHASPSLCRPVCERAPHRWTARLIVNRSKSSSSSTTGRTPGRVAIATISRAPHSLLSSGATHRIPRATLLSSWKSRVPRTAVASMPTACASASLRADASWHQTCRIPWRCLSRRCRKGGTRRTLTVSVFLLLIDTSSL